MRYTQWITTGVCLLIGMGVWAQGEIFDQLREVPTLSPQAASLAKQVEFPVSYYTGVADMSIPLYQVQSGDITVPITLGYSGSAIRVSEEASWVGLNFSLKAGGMISRQIKGKDDFSPTNRYFNTYYPPLANGNAFSVDYSNQIYMGCCYNMYNASGSAWPNTFNELISNDFEGEPDIYIYNFGAYSGKFFLSNNNTVYDLGKENIRLDYSGRDSIVMTDPAGLRYSFAQVERSETNGTINPSSYYLTRILSPTGKKVIFKYKNTAGTGSRVGQMPFVSEEYVVTDGTAITGVHKRSISQTRSEPICLDSIVFDKGYVKFQTATREDLNGQALTSLSINDKKGNLLKSYSFTYGYFTSPDNAPNDNDFLNTVTAGPLTTQINALAYPVDFKKKRLRLDMMSESSGTQQGQVYSFEYYDGGVYSLPYKSSRAQDYWGYYNGRTGSSTLVPDYRPISASIIYPSTSSTNSQVQLPSKVNFLNPFSGFIGANRNPDEEKVKAGMLKKVTYPTKGWTAYEYESNRYTNVGTEGSAQQVATGIVFANDMATSSGVAMAYLTLTGWTDVTVNVTLRCDNFGMYTCPNYPGWDCGCLGGGPIFCNATYLPNTLYGLVEKLDEASGNYLSIAVANHDTLGLPKISIDNLTCDNHGFFSANYRFPAGVYRLTANYPDNKTVDPPSTNPNFQYGKKLASVSITYTYTYIPPIEEGPQAGVPGGGLRISGITKYNPVSDTKLTKTYLYRDGTLMRAPIYYWHNIQVVEQGGGGLHYVDYFDYLYATPAVSYSTSADGGLLGYGSVIEKGGAGQAGFTTYEYENRPDKFKHNLFIATGLYGGIMLAYMPGISSTPYLANGFLKRKTVHDKKGRALKEIFNLPEIKNPYTYWSLKKNDILVTPGDTYDCSAGHCANTYFYFYPIQMGKVVTSQSFEKDFSYSDTVTNTSSATVQKNTSYTYNGDAYLSSQTIINSGGPAKTFSSKTKYPNDYSATALANQPWIQALKNKNMVNVPLEQLQMVNTSVTGGTFLTYETIGSLMAPSQVYKIQTAVPNSAIASTTTTGTIPAEFKLQGTLKYNTDGNLSYSQAVNDLATVYLWGYNKSLPIAKVLAATTVAADLYFNGFEEAAGTDDANTHTGTKVYAGGSYTIPTADYNPAASNLKMSYWYWDGSQWNFSGELPFSRTINSTGTKLDDIRAYPAGVQMTTYTYDPLKGMTSATDENNVVTIYEYDNLGRLLLIRDFQRNIIKYYTYHYAAY